MISLRKKLLQEAIRIGDELISKARRDGNGIYWETVGVGPEPGKFLWRKIDNVYGGTAGVVLFLIELYKKIRSPRFLTAINEAEVWLQNYCDQNSKKSFALYTGRLGVAIVLCKVALLNKNQQGIKRAVDIVKQANSAGEASCDDLLNGTAGTLLGLMHIHHMSKDDTLIPLIEHHTEHLIQSAHLSGKGVYWDKSGKNIRGLCGFSHGVAGVATVFMELGHYFGNPDFYYVAEQAMMYENAHFDQSEGNWPDFRKGVFDKRTFAEHEEAYLNGDRAFFTEANIMSAWCHGAPGIGFSRIRAHELLGTQYLEDVTIALEKTAQHTIEGNGRNTYTLCHGHGGNAMLFLEAYKQYRNEEYLNLALGVAEEALRYKEEQGIYHPGLASAHDIEDNSLFIGNAGIGYFYLMCVDPLNTPNILNPLLSGAKPERHEVLSSINKHCIQKTWLQRAFPKSISRLGARDSAFRAFLKSQGPKDNLKTAFIRWLKKQAKDQSPSLQGEVYLESKIAELEESIDSLARLSISRLVTRKLNDRLLGQLFISGNLELSLAPYSLLVDGYDEKNQSIEEKKGDVLLYANTDEVLVFPLDDLSAEIIRNCLSVQNANRLVSMVALAFVWHTEVERVEYESIIRQQVEEMVRSGVLAIHQARPGMVSTPIKLKDGV